MEEYSKLLPIEVLDMNNSPCLALVRQDRSLIYLAKTCYSYLLIISLNFSSSPFSIW